MNVETIVNSGNPVETGLMPVVQNSDTLTPKLGKETVGNGALHSDWKLPLASLPITQMAPKDDGLTSSSQSLVARSANQAPLGETTTSNKLLGQPDHIQLVGNLDLKGDSLARQPKSNGGFASTRTRSALRATASPASSPLKLEAESLALKTYRVEANAIASGSKLVSLRGGKSGESGSVSGTFNGTTGKYNVVVGYYDENDGVSKIEARLGGKTIGTATLDQKLNSSNVSKDNLVRRTLASGITVNKGTSLELLGTENSGEHARIDYVEFVPVSGSVTPTPPPPPAAGDTQAPTAKLTASNVTAKGGTSKTFTVAYTDNAGINATTLDNADVRVTGSNNFSQLASLVSVSGSGTSRTATYQVNAPEGTWDTADNGAYTVALQANQVRDTSDNAANSGTLGSFAVNVATTPTPPPPPTPPSGGGKTYFEDDFSNGYSKTWNKEAANLSHSIQTTKAPDGSDAVRFELRRNDPDISTSRRSELVLKPVAAGSEQWYGFRTMIPEGWEKDPGSFEIAGQWAQVPDFDLGESWRSPALNISIRNGEWRINNRWDSKPKTNGNTPEGSANLWSSAYDTGEWANWVFHVKWSHTSSGILQVWKDGQLIVDKKGPNSYNDKGGPYFKMGIYKPDWKHNPQLSNTDKRVLYYDQVRVGDNNAGYNAVAPR